MKKLLCVILALPLVVFGVENAVDSADSTDLTRKGTNIKTFDSVGAKSDSKKFRQKGLKTKEPDGFMLGFGNVFGGVIGGNPYNKSMGGGDIFGKNGLLSTFEPTPRIVPLSGVELLFGYKWFFGSGVFGMRLYGRYEFLYELIAMTNHFSVNYDLLFNFNQNKPFNFRDKFVYEGIKLHEMSNISTGSEISLMGMTRFIYTF